MSDKDGVVLRESRIAEEMVGMNVRVNDVTNRLRRYLAERSEETRALARAAAGVDHGDRVVADNKPNIGGVALIGRAHHVDIADVNINAWRDL